MSSRACTSREVPRLLALEPENFSVTAAYSFVFTVWGAIKLASLFAGALHLQRDGLGSP